MLDVKYKRSQKMSKTTTEHATMPIDPKLAERIRVLMAMRRVNQSELSRKTGLSRSTLGRIMDADDSDVRMSSLESIARALGCKLTVLIEDD
jgi:DNA-binding Xre family transcriptional regulator